MELFPPELTAAPVPLVAIAGSPDITLIIERKLNATTAALPVANSTSLGDFSKLPRFRAYSNPVDDWISTWTSRRGASTTCPASDDGNGKGMRIRSKVSFVITYM